MLIAPPASPPSPTPTPTLASVHGLLQLQPRQTGIYGGYTYGGYAGSDCYNYDIGKAQKCVNIITRCYEGGNLNAVATNPSAATSCFCTYGVSYLDCFFKNVATGTCAGYYLGGMDWNEFQMSYYTDLCGSIPASVMAKMKAPTSVSLALQTVNVVTVDGKPENPDYDGRPNYDGTGALLSGNCAETDFTLVDAGSTMFYAGFVGCIKDKPECCPWPVSTQADGAIAAAQTEEAGSGNAEKLRRLGADYPQPANQKLLEMASCASDYYSISGACCPAGYWPFTREVGGQTPCWKSMTRMATPPKLTVAKDGETKTEKATSAVVNIIWAMSYPVADQGGGGGLSTAAKAGIGAGAGIAAILIIGLVVALVMYRRKNKNKKLQDAQAGPQPPVEQIVTQDQQLQTQQQQQQQQQHHQSLPPYQQKDHYYPPTVTQYYPVSETAGGPGPYPQYDQQTVSSTHLSTLYQPSNNNNNNNGSVISELTSSTGLNQPSPGPAGYYNHNFHSNSQTPPHPHPIAEAPDDEAAQQQQYGYIPGGSLPPPPLPPPGSGVLYSPPQPAAAQAPEGAGPGYYYQQQDGYDAGNNSNNVQGPAGPGYQTYQTYPNYPGGASEMSAGRETEPPQEVPGSFGGERR